MKFNNIGQAQRNRRVKESFAKLIIDFLWFIIKWSFMIAFFPITIIYYLIIKKK